jgi:hypothetical protein
VLVTSVHALPVYGVPQSARFPLRRCLVFALMLVPGAGCGATVSDAGSELADGGVDAPRTSADSRVEASDGDSRVEAGDGGIPDAPGA